MTGRYKYDRTIFWISAVLLVVLWQVSLVVGILAFLTVTGRI